MQALLITLMFNFLGFTFNPMVDSDPEETNIECNSASLRRAIVVDSMMSRAYECLGIRYQYGGNTTKGFDCSGFVNYVYSAFGISLPRSSHEIALLGEKVAFDDLQPGDLVFFKGSRTSSTRVGHVGMVIEKTESGFKMIHASVAKGVRIDNYSDPYYKARFLFGKRLALV
jgi:cell wall-associated NlpC family hydrolase